MGPWIATGIDPRDMTTTVHLNGETIHKFPTGNMLFRRRDQRHLAHQHAIAR